MRAREIVAGALLVAALLGGCGDDEGDDAASQSGNPDGTAETAPSEPSPTSPGDDDVPDRPLRIVVTNDDGYASEGIDVVTQALLAEGHQVEVVAPLEQQSGTGGTFTEGAVETQEEQTASGREVVAVDGFPADAVRVAIDELELDADLVVSGINEGQNVGPLVDVSGTIGAARAAVARGIPALALSASVGPFEAGYAVGAELAVEWIDEHLDALITADAPVEVTSVNIPSCAEGEPEELIEVPVATGGDPLGEPDCASDVTDPSNDVEALAHGFPTLSVVPAEPATPPQPG